MEDKLYLVSVPDFRPRRESLVLRLISFPPPPLPSKYPLRTDITCNVGRHV